MENEIISLKEDLDWENKFAYEISAFEKAHRTYAEYLLEKGISLKDIEKLIRLIPKSKRDRFDENITEKLCKRYLN